MSGIEIGVECECGNVLQIRSINNITVTVESCDSCASDNYDEGEQEGKANCNCNFQE